MKKIIQLVLVTSLVLLSGCDFRVKEGDVSAKLNFLETNFGIQWPTNCISQYGGSLSVPLSGVSDIAARLEMTDATFSLWRQSATNKLTELPWRMKITDSTLEKYFSWWDCSKFPASQVILYYSNDRRAGGNHAGLLDVFVVETNGTRIMFIHGSAFR